MGYILTSAVSPDADLIAACAQYIAGDDDAGAMQDICGMTATTPEGWRALAAAADHAAGMKGGSDAAALIFAMQRSLLSKRKRIRGETPGFAEPAHFNQPQAATISRIMSEDAEIETLSTAEIAESWCTGTPVAREIVVVPCVPGLAARIQARQRAGQGLAGDWKAPVAYLNAMKNLTPDAGQFLTIA